MIVGSNFSESILPRTKGSRDSGISLEDVPDGSEDNGGMTGQGAIDQLWDRVGGGLRTYRNSLILVAPDRELWDKAEQAVREVLAYETVIGSIGKQSAELSGTEKRELESRPIAATPEGTARSGGTGSGFVDCWKTGALPGSSPPRR